MYNFIRKKREFKEPIELVWRVLTESESIERWFMQTDFRAEEGVTFNFIDYPGNKWKGMYSCEMISILPPQNVGFTWVDDKIKLNSHVWIRLSRKRNGTVFELEHKGFKGIRGIMHWWKYNMFWNQKLKSLRMFLNKQPYQVEYKVRNKRL